MEKNPLEGVVVERTDKNWHPLTDALQKIIWGDSGLDKKQTV